jgi:tetratricopeptide (TPR) repeat protein
MATSLNSSNATNWANLGYVYQSLNGLIGDTSTFAMGAYDQALTLDPNNPYLLSQEGTVNYISAQSLGQDKADQKAQLLAAAKDKIEKAVKLNPNYDVALYSAGLIYDALGNKAAAIDAFKKVGQLDPKDTNIPKILDNLNAGLPALQGPGGTPTPTPPATDSNSTNPAAQNSSATTTPPKTTTKTK